MKPNTTTTLVLAIFSAITIATSVTADEGPLGIIKGKVIDKETKTPIPGASVLIFGTRTGTNSDSDGNFTIRNVPIGDYTLHFNCIGYEPLAKTDIIVKPQRLTFVQASLKVSPVILNDVVVSGGYFVQQENAPTSAVNFSAEEIRRAPGSAGDVSRILMTLPSVAKLNDSYNSLIVRGGSPNENGFFVDNIEIPNMTITPPRDLRAGRSALSMSIS
jgi:hypothetical protein